MGGLGHDGIWPWYSIRGMGSLYHVQWIPDCFTLFSVVFCYPSISGFIPGMTLLSGFNTVWQLLYDSSDWKTTSLQPCNVTFFNYGNIKKKTMRPVISVLMTHKKIVNNWSLDIKWSFLRSDKKQTMNFCLLYFVVCNTSITILSLG